MKYKILIFLALAFSFFSCTDTCRQVRTYRSSKAVSIAQESLAKSIGSAAPQDLKMPGKIYVYGDYLLISETKKGVHVIDNSDTKNPKNISFITVPGVLDMAVKDDILYVDNYTDLVSLSIADPRNIKEVGRKKLQFNYGLHEGYTWNYDPYSKIITDYQPIIVTEEIKVSCENGSYYGPQPYLNWANDISYKAGVNGTSGASSTGTGGSMARFTIYDNYLYSATNSDLLVFSIKNKTTPDSLTKINLGWGIETIFPYQDKLFIGSNTGMYIFNNSNPEKPVRVSVFQHARACDPVVVEGNTAYVTLRQGFCGAAPNRLDVVDITNVFSPRLIKNYPLENPHGLSIDNKKLTICEGKFGLKSFDASNSLDIKLLQHIKDIEAFDVIQLPDNLLIIVGKNGIFQYDNTNASNLKLLSSILVKK